MFKSQFKVMLTSFVFATMMLSALGSTSFAKTALSPNNPDPKDEKNPFVMKLESLLVKIEGLEDNPGDVKKEISAEGELALMDKKTPVDTTVVTKNGKSYLHVKYATIKGNFDQTHMALRDPKTKALIHVTEHITGNPFNVDFTALDLHEVMYVVYVWKTNSHTGARSADQEGFLMVVNNFHDKKDVDDIKSAEVLVNETPKTPTDSVSSENHSPDFQTIVKSRSKNAKYLGDDESLYRQALVDYLSPIRPLDHSDASLKQIKEVASVLQAQTNFPVKATLLNENDKTIIRLTYEAPTIHTDHMLLSLIDPASKRRIYVHTPFQSSPVDIDCKEFEPIVRNLDVNAYIIELSYSNNKTGEHGTQIGYFINVNQTILDAIVLETKPEAQVDPLKPEPTNTDNAVSHEGDVNHAANLEGMLRPIQPSEVLTPPAPVTENTSEPAATPTEPPATPAAE